MLCQQCDGRGYIHYRNRAVRIGGTRRDPIVMESSVTERCDQCHGTGRIDCSEGSERHGNMPEEEK